MDRNQEKISVGQSPEGKQEEFGVEQSPGQVMENKHDSFVMYRSFVNVAKQLGGDFCNRFIMCICDYGLDGKEPEEPDLQVFFAIIKPLIDKAHKRHDARRNNGKKGAEYGKLGGAPKGNQNARKNFEQQPQNNPKTTH